MYPSVPPVSDECVTLVELYIKCRNLLNKDVMSLSDPLAAVYIFERGCWKEVGRTEKIVNSLNPEFSKPISIRYYFEEVQKLRICVYDIDNATASLSDDDFLGEIECTLGQIVSCSPFTKTLTRGGNGSITVSAEEITQSGEIVTLKFDAEGLDKKDFFGLSDPYIELFRQSDSTWQLVHRTEFLKNTLNPKWHPFDVKAQMLCKGDRKAKIRIDCYDWDSDGSHDFIGSCSTTLGEMEKATDQPIQWQLINPKKVAKKKNYKNSGILILRSIRVVKLASFLEFVFGGMQINFTVAVDFTGSNGNPRMPDSLHYMDPYRPNQYMQAIKAVGNVCQDYDSDKYFPALGFGAKIPPLMQVSHEFPLNFNMQNPFCAGIDGVLAAYQNCLPQIQLYGPTNASPIINHVAGFARAAQAEEPQKGAHAYFILLLLTDGVLTDMNDTKTAIVQASHLPMSLIIVGVGNADFTDMDTLDADNEVLKDPWGRAAVRDIVQFVPFREFVRNPGSEQSRESTSVELARHVLAEVPKQVEGYYQMRGIPANARRVIPPQPVPTAAPPPFPQNTQGTPASQGSQRRQAPSAPSF